MNDDNSSIKSGTIIAKRFEVVRALNQEFGLQSFTCKDSSRNNTECVVSIVDENLIDQITLAELKRDIRRSMVVKHSNIASALELLDTEGLTVITSELGGAATLDSLALHNQALKISEVIHILLDCLSALDITNQNGLCHNDINPQNIAIAENGAARLLRLGFRSLLPCNIDYSLENNTTKKYLDCIAPEYLENEHISIQNDIYSLGVIAYRLITGASPFKSNKVQELIEEKLNNLPAPPHHIAEDCPDKLSAIVMRMIAPDARIRYSSAAEAFIAIKSIELDKNSKTTLAAPVETRALRILDLPLYFIEAYLPKQTANAFSPLSDSLIRIQSAPYKNRLRAATLLIIVLIIPIITWGYIWPANTSHQISTTPESETPSEYIDTYTSPQIFPTPAESDYPNEFTVGQPSKLNGSLYFSAQIASKYKIVKFDLESRAISKVVDLEFDTIEPTLSANGNNIAFVGINSGDPQLYVGNLGNKDWTAITKLPHGAHSPNWSRHSDILVFSAEIDPVQRNFDPPTEIFSVDINGDNLVQVTQLGGKNTNPSWSIDEKQILYATNRYWPGTDICIWDTISKEERCERGGTTNYSHPKWLYQNNTHKIISLIGATANNYPEIYNIDSKNSVSIPTIGGDISEVIPTLDNAWFIALRKQNRDGISEVFAIDTSGQEIFLFSTTVPIKNITF